ncbi:hypothetical protein [Cerasicoccus frondis]|uniref:hypothetical protein n=1 Tax=Cerasicoccus frondis TaxID=490090 RepID=UPI002852AEC4|nr:hypothetical protein [Cerasicoccus frondis]
MKSQYAKILSPFPEEEKKEILKEFYRAHRDFRDSVQVPSVVATLSAILLQAAAFTFWTGLVASLIITPLVFAYYFVVEAGLSRRLNEKNVIKMRHFLENWSEPVATGQRR